MKNLQIALIVLMCSWPALGQGQADLHAQHHEELYRNWMIPNTNISCCNNQDCAPAESRVVQNGYEFKFEGKWWPVPENKVLKEGNTDGQSHVCLRGPNWNPNSNPSQRVICFMPGVLM